MALKVRGETLRRRDRRQAPSCWRPRARMLSSITGVWPQPNKAIVGRNAFAHEAGIHQHGMLANPLSYEIMTPASVGVARDRCWCSASTRASTRCESRLRALGLAPQGRRARGDHDARSRSSPTGRSSSTTTTSSRCVAARARAPRRASCATRPLAGNQRPAHGHGRGRGRRRSAGRPRRSGNGPLDAALKAADAALGLDLELLEMHTRAVTAGKDALAEVIVRVRHDGHRVLGPGREHRHHRGHAQGLPLGGGRGAAARGRGLGGGVAVTARGRCSRRSGTRTSCAGDRRDAGGALRRPAPRPRGDLAPGLRGAARARPQGAPARPHRGHHGPLDAHRRRASAAAS